MENRMGNAGKIQENKPPEKSIENPEKKVQQEGASMDEITGDLDDNLEKYKDGDQLLPDNTYVLNENRYETDEQGRPIHVEAKVERTPENPRDNEAQGKVGGKDRREGDQGGHIIGRDLSGDGGVGNLVPMDARINQSDYKRMENDIKRALDEGHEVKVTVDFEYSGDSKRPDKIKSTVEIDGKKTEYAFDNNMDGSLEGRLQERYSGSDLEVVQGSLEETGGVISSIKDEYDAAGNLQETTVTITYVDAETGKTMRVPVSISAGGAT